VFPSAACFSKPSTAKQSQSRAKHSQAQPSKAKQSQAKPSKAKFAFTVIGHLFVSHCHFIKAVFSQALLDPMEIRCIVSQEYKIFIICYFQSDEF
jgi:hypothetical protein